MANSNTTQASDLRAEFDALKDEVSSFINTLKDYERERVNDTKDNISAKASRLRSDAKDKLKDAQNLGENTREDVEGKIRDNPLASLAVAFAVGFIASKLTRPNH